MDLDKEWSFIISETHREKPSKRNRVKREMLFALEIMLSKSSSLNISDYNRLKEIYLKVGV